MWHMRLGVTAALFCAAFGKVAPAETISFSGSIDAGETFHDIDLTGTDGLGLHSDIPSGFANAPRSTCVSPCVVSLGFPVYAFDEPGYWSTSFEGAGFSSSYYNQAGTIGGFLQFTSPPFVPSDISTLMFLPMTFSGEIWAKFPEGSYLYDLLVSGSSPSIEFGTAPFGSGVYEFYGLRGSLTGTAAPAGTSVPEPGTVVLLLAGAALVILRRVSNYAGALTAWRRSAK